ncbi:MAG: hypothetical protein WEB31_05760 [Chthoniobacterales bacterium]
MACKKAATTLRRLGTMVSKSQHPEDAERADDGPGSGPGHQGDGHDDKVEDVPSAPPEKSAEGEELADDLDDEDGKAGLVDRDEQWTRAGHEVFVCLESENDRIDQDHADDKSDDARGFHPAGQLEPPWSRTKGGESVDELLFQRDHDRGVFSHG